MPNHRHCPALLLLLGLLLAATSRASGEERLRILEEVVVAAQRVEESAQAAPVSLVSFDSEAMAVLGIGNIAEINAQVPNFSSDRFPSSNQTLRLFIRGIGITDVQITQDPAVGVYMDGVYLARSTGLAADLADLERIEVLRGPQGTLYGRNTTGGALNLFTRRPDTEAVAFRLSLGAGDRELLQSRTVLNLPLGGGNAVKFAGLLKRQDGFINNAGPGGGFGDLESSGWRLDWRWRPDSAFTVDYTFDNSSIESHNYTPQAVYPGIPTGTPTDAAIISSRRFVPYGESRFDTLATSTPLQPTDTEISGHMLTLQWQLGELALKSITAYRELEDRSYIDFASGASEEYRVDFSAITLGAGSSRGRDFDTVRSRLEQDQWSQEFQLNAKLNEQFELLAGLYAFTEEARENWFPMHHIFSFPVIETGDAATAVNIRAEDNLIDNSALALYGQLSWTPPALAHRWQFSLGLRHSRDEREVERLFRQDNYVDFGDLVLGPFESIDFAADASDTFDDTSLSLLAEYQFTGDINLYGKYVEAYKSGGFNTRDPDPGFFSQGFDEEKNRTAELGFKGEFLGRALRVNSALFYSRVDDMQLNFLLPGSISDTRVFNSGNATLSGVELEITAMPWYGLLLNFHYAYLDSEIDDVVDPFSGEPRSFGFSNAPRNSASLNLNYRIATTLPGVLDLNLNYNYIDARSTHDSLLAMDSYSLLNGRVALSDIALRAGRFSLATWVKNALDEDYVSFTIDNLPHASRAVLWGEPRSWGLEAVYQY